MTSLALPGITATGKEHLWREHETIRTRAQGTVHLHNVLVTSVDALSMMERELCNAEVIAGDTETSGLVVALGAHIIGYAFAYESKPHVVRAFYVPIHHIYDQAHTQLPEAVVTPVILRILCARGALYMHHAKFDLGMYRAHGLRWRRTVHDASVRAVISNENELSWALKKLAAEYISAEAQNEESALDDWMKRDARMLGIPYKKRKRGQEQIIGPVTYMEKYGYSRTPISLCGVYACHDVFYTLFLVPLQEREVSKYQPLYAREMGVSDALLDMEWTGLLADPEQMKLAQVAANEDSNYYLHEMRRLLGEPTFDPTAEAMRDLFYARLKMAVPKQTKSKTDPNDSVDKEARDILIESYPAHAPLLKLINAHAKIDKIGTTYGAAFLRYWSPRTHCIHASYNQLEDRDEGGVPVTGRLSSQHPNTQNIAKKPIHLLRCGCADCVKDWAKGKLAGPERKPGEKHTLSIRRYFLVPKGRARIFIDLSQIELRILAFYSRDPILLDAYARDLDIHAITAEQVTSGDRDIAKQVNFGNSYGMTEIGLAKRMEGYAKDPEGTRAKAAKVLVAFFATYAGIPRFRDDLSRYMRWNGNSFVSVLGRPRRIPDIGSNKRWERERAERMMMSSIISGTAADMMKEILLRCRAYLFSRFGGHEACLSDGILPKQTIHDEIIYDVPIPGIEQTCRDLMHYTTWWPLFEQAGVPIRAGIKVTTTTWEDARDVLIGADGSVAFAPKK